MRWEQLLAEELPTGSFGGPRPQEQRSQAADPKKTPDPRAAEHRAVLEAELADWYQRRRSAYLV